MLNSKQRAYLRSLAHDLSPIFNVGKGGVNEEMIISIGEALEKRELVKIAVLKNCFIDPKDVAAAIAEGTRSTVVQVIGKKITLYKKNYENPSIMLP